MLRYTAALLFAALLLDATAAAAASHIRGQVAMLAGAVATVATTDGATVELTLEPDFGLVVYRPIALEDLQPDDYLSIPSTRAPDGHKQAITIGVLPAGAARRRRGRVALGPRPGQPDDQCRLRHARGPGPRPHHRRPLQGHRGNDRGPGKHPDPRLRPGPGRKLAVGDKAFFFATETDGKLTARRAGVMADGSMPPM